MHFERSRMLATLIPNIKKIPQRNMPITHDNILRHRQYRIQCHL